MAEYIRNCVAFQEETDPQIQALLKRRREQAKKSGPKIP
jgi:hypothetical protein